MELTPDLWRKALLLYQEAERRGERLGRKRLREVLGISEPFARQILFAIENRAVIRHEPRQFDVVRRELVLADLHFPYHDPLAVETALSYADKFQPDIIVLLGDFLDMYDISPFVRKPRELTLRDEIKSARDFLFEIHKRFPQAKIILQEGNHEARLQRYILRNADKIWGLVDETFLPSLLGIYEVGGEYVEGPFKIGQLWHLHGHEKLRGGNPEYITNVIWRQIHDHFIVGHWHREQQKIFRKIDGTTFWGGAVGHLSDVEKAEYAKVNNWTQGFATVEYDKKGEFRAQLHRIENGNLY